MSPDDRRVLGLTALLAGSAIAHFAIPSSYEKIIPPALPNARAFVYGSAIAELACAVLLVTPSTRRLGALASAGLFVGVFPANLYAVKVAAPSRIGQALTLIRLPFQVPMITAAMKVARGR